MSFNDLLSALGLDDPKTIWGWILFLYFMGLVLGAENDETILGNMQNLMNMFGI
jgi:hypothetical protein